MSKLMHNYNLSLSPLNHRPSTPSGHRVRFSSFSKFIPIKPFLNVSSFSKFIPIKPFLNVFLSYLTNEVEGLQERAMSIKFPHVTYREG